VWATLLLAAVTLVASAAPPERVVDFPCIRAYVPFLRPARYKGAYGGRGSAKSHEFAKNVLKFCVEHPGARVVCLREIQLSLKQSVKRLLEDKIKVFGIGDLFEVTNTEIRTPGGGVIVFQGLQDHTAESIKSLEGFDVGWVEEAQTVSIRSLDLLRPTIRKDNSELWFTWNPRRASDPIDLMLRGSNPPPGAVVVRTSFADNPFFPDVLRVEMEWDRGRDPDKYAHIWLGEYEKNSEARVFKNWRIEDVEAPDGTAFYQGADWGYSVDPAVMVRSWLRSPRELVIDSEAYRIGCEIDDIPALFDGLECGCDYKSPRPCIHANSEEPWRHGSARKWETLADSQRPDTISYLNRHGYPRIRAAKKGPNSVKDGVIFLQSFNIIVRPRATHTIDELTCYSYVVDKKTVTEAQPLGVVTNVLEDKKNHVIDSLRYSVEKLRGAKRLTW